MMSTETSPKRASATDIVLATIGIAGLLTMAILAPNAIQSLKMFQRKKGKHYKMPEQQVRTSLSRAIQQGLVSIQMNEDGRKIFSLTPQGEKRLWQYEVKNLNFEKPKKWDRKWRLIIFDIRERRRGSRDWLRLELSSIGFIKLQNSVWVFPYDCEELIALLKVDAELGRNVLYVVADSIENDLPLRKHFKLEK